MNAAKFDEKRKHLRVGFATEIKIVINAGDKEINAKGSSKDLSLKGIFCSTDEKIDKGTECDIAIYLTGSIDKIVLNINGTVVRVDDAGIGVSFDSMDVETYSHLKNIVQYNSEDAT